MTTSAKLISNAKFYESYARYNEVEKRYETWDEAVARVMNMHRTKYASVMTPTLSGLLDVAELSYRKQEMLGAQRALQFGGEQLLKANAKMYNCTASYCDRSAFFGETFYLMLCGCGVGFSVQHQHVAKLPDITKRTKQAKTFIVEDSIEGWASAVGALMQSFFVDPSEFHSRKIYFDLTKIRLKGAEISGGFKAPGPDPLRKALDKIEKLIKDELDAGATRLRPIVAYDICMHVADAVISGGVRRAATICLFSFDDQEMITAKTGDWFVSNPQRGRSNNSVVLLRDEITHVQFAEIMESVKHSGEPGFVWTDDLEILFNPCVSGDTLIHLRDHNVVSNGKCVAKGLEYTMPIKLFYDTYGNCKNSIVPLVKSKNLITGTDEYKQVKWSDLTKRNAELLKITAPSGKSIKVTPDHKVYTVNRGWVEARNLIETDTLVEFNA